MKQNTNRNAETLRQIFSVDDNKFNPTFTSNRTRLGEYEHQKHLLDKVEHVTKSLKCTIVAPPNYVDDGLELEFFRDNLDEIKVVLNDLGINTNNINKNSVDKQHIKGVEIIVSVKEESILTQEEITYSDIAKLKSKFSEMLQEAIDNDKLKTGSYRRNNMKIQFKRCIKSGASAGYDVTVRGIELDNRNRKMLSYDYDEQYDLHTVQVKIPVKPCVAEYWSAEGYYDGIDSTHDVYDPKIDSQIDGGTAILQVEVYPPQWIKGDIMTSEELNEAIDDLLPSELNLTMMYGGSWSHSYLPEEGITFDDDNGRTKLDEGETYDYTTVRCVLKCPNITQNINAFFENPDAYYVERLL